MKKYWLLFLTIGFFSFVSLPGKAATPHPRILLSDANVKALLESKVASSDETWLRLKKTCDSYLERSVSYPDGDDYPNNGIGEGYQGEEYFDPILNLGVCFQVQKNPDADLAARYAKKGIEILSKMSVPPGSAHSVNALRDSGYGIRFYGVGMAIGYDWFNEKMTAAEKKQVYTSLNYWIEQYEKSGFGRNHPQGNYYAGYYAAKALTALATLDENPSAENMWQTWLSDQHNNFVAPYYEKWLKGGGWSEGWNYGPLATINMSWPIIAAKTAKGLDLVHDAGHPFSFPLAQASYLMYFAWPNQLSLDDRGEMKPGDNPSAASAKLYTFEAGLLELFNDPRASAFHQFASEVRTKSATLAPAWEDVVFWNSNALSTSYTSWPTAYFSQNSNQVSVRSDWTNNAVLGTFIAGPYTNNPDSGEEFFDQGSLAIVKGNTPFLVNTAGAITRNTIAGTSDKNLWQNIYDTNFGGSKPRNIYNIFYPGNGGQNANSPSLTPSGLSPKTSLIAFTDTSLFSAFRGENLEDMYTVRDAQLVTKWSREVVYIRPDVFIIFDHTKVPNAQSGEYMAFHFSAAPKEESLSSGTRRFTFTKNNNYLGSVTTLYPAENQIKTTNVFDSNKVFRLEVRPTQPQSEEFWLTALDAARTSQDYGFERLPVTGAGLGTFFKNAAGNFVVVFNKDNTLPFTTLSYRTPITKTQHIISSLPVGNYSVQVKTQANENIITISLGGNESVRSDGRLVFTTEGSQLTINNVPSSSVPTSPFPAVPVSSSTPSSVPLLKTVPIFRLFNKQTGADFLTLSLSTKTSLLKNSRVWQDKSINQKVIALSECDTTMNQVRLFVTKDGKRSIYTTSLAEKAVLSKNTLTWVDKGDVFCSYATAQKNTVVVLRFRNTRTGVYMYTSNPIEQANLKKQGYKQENTAFFAL